MRPLGSRPARPSRYWASFAACIGERSNFALQLPGASKQGNGKRLVQTLVGFQAVCTMCHHVTHFGKAQLLADKGRLDLDAVIEHFMKVNGVTREAFESHKGEAFRGWRERSQHQWQTDLGQWVYLLPRSRA